MTEDQFDALVNDASHIVFNLIPSRYLNRMGDNACGGLFVSINDALATILRDATDSARSDSDNPTRACTIAAMICELLETHLAKCNEGSECEEDRSADVISEVHGTSANIESIASCDVEGGTEIHLALDDSTAFRITVEAVSS